MKTLLKTIISLDEIRKAREEGISIIELADKYNINPHSLYSWSHRNGIYNINKCRILVECNYCGVWFKGTIEKRRPNKKHYCCKEHYSKWLVSNSILSNPETNPTYIDGTYKDKDSRYYRKSPEYNKWRNSVFERDDWFCKICEERGGKLEAHHILPQKDYPELIYDLENGVTLCKDCHIHKVNGHEYEWVDYFHEAMNYASII
jgi:5-methylcytosine-specific restriction endonuclease McrA